MWVKARWKTNKQKKGLWGECADLHAFKNSHKIKSSYFTLYYMLNIIILGSLASGASFYETHELKTNRKLVLLMHFAIFTKGAQNWGSCTKRGQLLFHIWVTLVLNCRWNPLIVDRNIKATRSWQGPSLLSLQWSRALLTLSVFYFTLASTFPTLQHHPGPTGQVGKRVR